MVEIWRVGEHVAQLGESPVWNESERKLYWVDIDGRAIHRTNPTTGETETRNLPGRPGSFVLTQTTGRLLVAMETSLEWFDWDSEQLERFVDVEVGTANRLNDGRCDPNGRYIVGTMNPDTARRRFDGGLYSIDRRGVVDVLEEEVGIPNSTVFDPERGCMYWADTFHGQIWRWDYNALSGRRSNKTLFFDYRTTPGVAGLPDGACLDSEGCVWSASVHGWALTRLTPHGEVDQRIELPVAMPTMPAFGGPDLSTIFVTSLQGGQVDEHRSRGIPAGALLAVDVGIPGLPEQRFAG